MTVFAVIIEIWGQNEGQNWVKFWAIFEMTPLSATWGTMNKYDRFFGKKIWSHCLRVSFERNQISSKTILLSQMSFQSTKSRSFVGGHKAKQKKERRQNCCNAISSENSVKEETINFHLIFQKYNHSFVIKCTKPWWFISLGLPIFS